MVQKRRRRRVSKKPEQLLSDRVANYMKTEHPTVPFRFDQIDQVGLVGGKRNRELHGVKWSRGYPDLLICSCRKGYGGLYLELKATDTVPNTEHTYRQALYHVILRDNGYKVLFACGFKQAKKEIKKYLNN